MRLERTSQVSVLESIKYSALIRGTVLGVKKDNMDYFSSKDPNLISILFCFLIKKKKRNLKWLVTLTLP